MIDFHCMKEPEGPSMVFPFNVPEEFLDGGEEDDILIQYTRMILRYTGVGM